MAQVPIMTSSPLFSGGGGKDYQTEDGGKEFERGTARKVAKNVTPVDVRTLQRHEVKLEILNQSLSSW